MIRFARTLALLVALATSTACIGLRGNESGPIQGWPPDVGDRPTLSYVLSGRLHTSDGDRDATQQALDAWQTGMEKVYVESGLFRSVTRGFANTDLRAEVELVDEGEANVVLAFLCGFTFFLIPATAADTFVVTTRFTDANGKTLGEVQKRESVRVWMHLLLLPVMPFKPFGSAAEGAYHDVHRATLLEARQRKLF